MTIDLEAQTIKGPDGGTIEFDIDPDLRHRLLNGIDDIGETMEKAGAIGDYEKRLANERPWV